MIGMSPEREDAFKHQISPTVGPAQIPFWRELERRLGGLTEGLVYDGPLTSQSREAQVPT